MQMSAIPAEPEPFTEEQQALAHFAGALAHPARIAIIGRLQEWGEAPCGHLVDVLPLAQATVSQHLAALCSAGLLHQRPRGKQILYSLNCEAVRAFCHSFQCKLGTIGENETGEGPAKEALGGAAAAGNPANG